MLGVYEVFSSDSKTFGQLAEGDQPTFSKVICAVYLCLSTIMLLNMLTAKMNRSYRAVDEEINKLWKLEVVKMVVDTTDSEVSFIVGRWTGSLCYH
jgi:hypothetical protein